jgi:hypothetical protein
MESLPSSNSSTNSVSSTFINADRIHLSGSHQNQFLRPVDDVTSALSSQPENSYSFSSSLLPTQVHVSFDPPHIATVPPTIQPSALVSDDGNSRKSKRKASLCKTPKKRSRKDARDHNEPKQVPDIASALLLPNGPAGFISVPVPNPPLAPSVSLSNQLEDNSSSTEQMHPQTINPTDERLAISDSSMFQQCSPAIQAFLSLNPQITPVVISLVTQQQHRESQQLQAQIDHAQFQLLHLKQLQQMQQMKHLQIRSQLQKYLHLMPHVGGLLPAFTGVALSTTQSHLTNSSVELCASSDSKTNKVSGNCHNPK